jgi:L-threonylcarbamoyladenylate synthase
MRVIDCAGRDALTAAEADLVAATARAGGVILYPTDTIYGLGADPGSPAGLAALCRLKGRDPGKPLPVLLAAAGLVDRYATAEPAPWRGLMERFWPGPLTLLFPCRPGLPPEIRSAAGKVALRVPGSALCRSVLLAAGGGLTGTSANVAGCAGTGDPSLVLGDLREGIDLFVNAGTLRPSRESTLIDLDAAGKVVILRPGAVPEAACRLALCEAPRAVDVG